MRRALMGWSLSAPAPESPFSNTGPGIPTSPPLLCILWSQSLQGVGGSSVMRHSSSHGIRNLTTTSQGGLAWGCSRWNQRPMLPDRQVSLCELMIRATPAQEETALLQCRNSDKYRLANPSFHILSLVLFKIPMHWGLN